MFSRAPSPSNAPSHPPGKPSIPELDHRAALRTAGRDANRAAIERRDEVRVGRLVPNLLEQWLDAEIDPAAEACVMVRGQEELGPKQLDQREGLADLPLGDRVRLIGDHRD